MGLCQPVELFTTDRRLAPDSLSHGKTLLDPLVYKDPMSFIPECWLLGNPHYDRISRLSVPFGKKETEDVMGSSKSDLTFVSFLFTMLSI